MAPQKPSSPSDEESHPFLSEDLENAIKLENSSRRDASKGNKITPLPKAQLGSLCAVRLVDPIAFTQIFPYVNEMMDHFNVTDDRSNIGFYSGMVVSREGGFILTVSAPSNIDRPYDRRAVLLFPNSFLYTTGQNSQVRRAYPDSWLLKAWLIHHTFQIE